MDPCLAGSSLVPITFKIMLELASLQRNSNKKISSYPYVMMIYDIFELIKGPSDKTTTISTILVVTSSTTTYRGSHLEK
jgi:hypothetical protein